MGLDGAGYLVVWTGRRGYLPYHQLVMNCTPKMDTHHIDFNKWNNRVENLAALTQGEHRKLHQESLPRLMQSRAKARNVGRLVDRGKL